MRDSKDITETETLAEQEPKRTVGGTLNDIVVTAAKGFQNAGDALIGLGNMASFGMLGKGLEKIGHYEGSGTLRAPALRLGPRFLVGWNEALYAEYFPEKR